MQQRCVVCGNRVGLVLRCTVAILYLLAACALGEIALLASEVMTPSPAVALHARVAFLLAILAGLLAWRSWDRRRVRDDGAYRRGKAMDKPDEKATRPIIIDDQNAREALGGTEATGKTKAA